MDKAKSFFKEFNLTWSKVIILALIMGFYTAMMALIPITRDTSFRDLAVTFEVWILFGIFIIMKSNSAKDSALKCFVFFLISQPLIYIIQDIINSSSLFKTYYKYWFMWTLACLPMGFLGYYMKKNKWWGLLILSPILLLLGYHYSSYLSQVIFSFPRHLLTVIFCIITMVFYPIVIFKNCIIKKVGLIIVVLILIGATILCVLNPLIYSTDILGNSEKYPFDDTYKVTIKDSSYGDISIRREETIDAWLVHAEFRKAGKTEFTLISPGGEKTTFSIKIE